MPKKNIPILWKVKFLLRHPEIVREAFGNDYLSETTNAKKELVALAIEQLGFSSKTTPIDILRSLQSARYWLSNPERLAFISYKENETRVWFGSNKFLPVKLCEGGWRAGGVRLGAAPDFKIKPKGGSL